MIKIFFKCTCTDMMITETDVISDTGSDVISDRLY